MNKFCYAIFALLFIIMINGCSNSSSEESLQADKVVEEKADSKSSSIANVGESNPELAKEETIQSENVQAEEGSTEANTTPSNDRMVIYTANLSIEVSSYQDTLKLVEQQIASSNGYIVESNSYSTGEENALEGTITVRIPQEKFDGFLQAVENGSSKVLDRSIAGQDVTEEYVDLDARLKSKQIVEKRLVDFMEKAEKTEDLLKISIELSKVQEEIEQIKGKMKYLDNKVELATVTIHVVEDKVNVPPLENKDLDTWEKTKEQFMNSVNFVLKACSAIIVFIIGSLPILLILGGLLFIMLVIIRKRRRHNQGKPPLNEENEE